MGKTRLIGTVNHAVGKTTDSSALAETDRFYSLDELANMPSEELHQVTKVRLPDASKKADIYRLIQLTDSSTLHIEYLHLGNYSRLSSNELEESAPYFSNLRCLSLGDNSKIICIHNAVSHMPRLELLSLGDRNKISSEALIAAAPHLRKLKYLNVGDRETNWEPIFNDTYLGVFQNASIAIHAQPEFGPECLKALAINTNLTDIPEGNNILRPSNYTTWEKFVEESKHIAALKAKEIEQQRLTHQALEERLKSWTARAASPSKESLEKTLDR